MLAWWVILSELSMGNALKTRNNRYDDKIFCVNQVEKINNSVKGKFYCPELGQNPDLYHCCGIIGEQYCCDPQDTAGFKWGIAVAVIVGVLVLLAVGYTIQVFRACDNCYHECPICSVGEEEEEFLWDTRWYSVSHEGNRYGVTFHSHKFAKYFMLQLENRYGPWNTANILRIKKDNHDFVVLNIFFHDLFTPWFYTQGPIKNDEEWIKSDFRQMCKIVKDTITVHPLECCGYSSSKEKQSLDNPSQALLPHSGIITSNSSSPSGSCPPPQRMLKPWTKTTFKGSHSHPVIAPNKKPLNIPVAGSIKDPPPGTKSIIIMDDIIEVFGNNKGIQTKREILVKSF